MTRTRRIALSWLLVSAVSRAAFDRSLTVGGRVTDHTGAVLSGGAVELLSDDSREPTPATSIVLPPGSRRLIAEVNPYSAAGVSTSLWQRGGEIWRRPFVRQGLPQWVAGSNVPRSWKVRSNTLKASHSRVVDIAWHPSRERLASSRMVKRWQ